jgi:hypothetical protein
MLPYGVEPFHSIPPDLHLFGSYWLTSGAWALIQRLAELGARLGHQASRPMDCRFVREDKYREEPTEWIHNSHPPSILRTFSCTPCFPTLFVFFLTYTQHQSTMAAELPSLRFRSFGSLTSLRRLMGWQAPGFEHRLKREVVPLANLALGDFIFFSAYALAGLVPPVSSFFLMLLEFYRRQLQHLSPNSITLVAIFIQLYGMFVGVRPSVCLFRRFFVMKAASQRPPLIGGYYFARRTQGPSRYIAPISPGRWERWREDWVLMQADAHDRLVIPAAAPTLNRAEWGKDPGLESGFDPVLDRIQYLAESGMTSLMVMHDFLSRRLAPIQYRATCPAWMYTGENDIMRLERGPGSRR